MPLYVELVLSKEESDLESAGLDGGVSLDAAAGRGHTHVAITGSDTAERFFVTEKPQRVRVPLPKTNILKDSDTHITVSNDARLLLSVDRLAASVAGVVTTSLAGQASAFLDNLSGDEKTLPQGAVGVRFAGWDDLAASVGIRDVRVVEAKSEIITPEDQGKQLQVHFASEKVSGRPLQAEQEEVKAELKKIYNESWQLRKRVVFAKAPTLTKSVMTVPVGMAGTGYDLSVSVVAKPAAQTAQALEDMMRAAIMSELAGQQSDFDAFLSKEGIESAQWAGIVMSALSTSASWLIPYKGDERTVVLPRGKLKAFSTESWLAEPTRLGMADDCDGSAAWITAAVYQIEKLFTEDGGSREMFPTLHAAWRALAMYKVGVAVLSAHAGKASDADGATGAIAGHAQVLALPKLHLLEALGCEDQDLAAARRELLFKNLILRIPSQELTDITRGDLDAAMRALPGLAAEGTGPANSQLWEPKEDLRNGKIATEKRVAGAFKAISPSQALPLRDLNVGPGCSHKFYDEFVEFITDWSMLDSPVLQARGEAAAHFVLGHGDSAGATPEQVATGNYTATPLWKADKKRSDMLTRAAERVQRNTLPMGKPVLLSAKQESDLQTSLGLLAELDKRLREHEADTGLQRNAVNATTLRDEIRAVIPFTSLINNPTGVANLVDLMEGSGQVDVSVIRDVAVASEPARFMPTWFGSHPASLDRGVFAVVTLFV